MLKNSFDRDKNEKIFALMLRPPKFVFKFASFFNGMFIVLASLTCRLPVKGSHRNFFLKMGSQNKKV